MKLHISFLPLSASLPDMKIFPCFSVFPVTKISWLSKCIYLLVRYLANLMQPSKQKLGRAKERSSEWRGKLGKEVHAPE